MKALEALIENIQVEELIGEEQVSIKEVCFDSREVVPYSLFIAIKGTQVDGHQFIDQVIESGAIVIVCENLPEKKIQGITYIKVKDSSAALGVIASAYYGHPSRQLKLVAITGTNGKTTVATLLFRLYREFGYRVGLLSTVQNQIDDEVLVATHTTPDALSLNKMLRGMVDRACAYCFMEASSHAIDQNRIQGLHLAGAIFTNITHDHLDYHGTFANYLKSKKKLFDNLGDNAFALTNKDDKNGLVVLQNTAATKYTYSLNNMSDFRVKIVESDFTGMLLNFDAEEVWFRLVGRFNAYNLLSVYGAAFLMGKEKEEILTNLSKIGTVNGRFDFQVSDNNVVGIVDYAHTPDALKNILATINELRTGNEQLITVVGCGGNRDKTKRPLMADIACDHSDKVIFTSDNPRDEDPDAIIEEMQKGVKPIHYKKTLKITDRKEAIRTAVSLTNTGDIILVAGKGHETYQEIKGVKHHFDDKEVLQDTFTLLQ